MYVGLIRCLLGLTKNHEKPRNYREKPGEKTNNHAKLYLGHKMYVGLTRRLLGSNKNHEKPGNYREKPGKPTNNSENIYLGQKMYVGLIRRLLGLTLLIQMDAASRTKSSALYKPFYPYRRK